MVITVIRKIIEIDQEKCNGCGLCAEACHEGAIQMINGKANLINDAYCDGLGNCLPQCPENAIALIDREALAYDEDLVNQRIAVQSSAGCACPGTQSRIIEPVIDSKPILNLKQTMVQHSELKQWPVQIKLVNIRAPYLDGAHILIAADCTAFAYGNFHQDFIRGKVTLIGCPKLDDNQYYMEKFSEILQFNNIKSITVVRMEVPCCSGIVSAVKKAMLNSGTIVPYNEIIISIDGQIIT